MEEGFGLQARDSKTQAPGLGAGCRRKALTVGEERGYTRAMTIQAVGCESGGDKWDARL